MWMVIPKTKVTIPHLTGAISRDTLTEPSIIIAMKADGSHSDYYTIEVDKSICVLNVHLENCKRRNCCYNAQAELFYLC